MVYLIELLLLIIMIGIVLRFATKGKKPKNGVFQTIIKDDVNKNRIVVKTEIIINNKVFDSFEEAVIGVGSALEIKKEAKKKGEIMYKRAKQLMKK